MGTGKGRQNTLAPKSRSRMAPKVRMEGGATGQSKGKKRKEKKKRRKKEEEAVRKTKRNAK